MPEGMDRASFDSLVEAAFAARDTEALGETHALLIVHGGRIVHERYGEAFNAQSTHHSWSIAKSITHALVGILVREGRIDAHAPADVPEWRNDARAAITLDHLLRMSSGLKFIEDYAPDGGPSDVIAMLFGEGKPDVAAHAARQPLIHPPGTFWSYSSGTTNIVARCAARATNAKGPAFEAFMRSALFQPLGITSAKPLFDEAGTFIGSSFCFMTARDFARFGLLYLRDGIWDGARLLPQGWVDYARTETPRQPTGDMPYGAHWWLGFGGEGSFSANGYDGQFIVLLPKQDMLIVRHGRTPLDKKDNLQRWIAVLSACFEGVTP